MAKIDLQEKKRGGMGWLWVLLLLVVLALLAWWLWPEAEFDLSSVEGPVEEPYGETGEPYGAEETAVDPEVDTEGTMVAAAIPITRVVNDPAAWDGRTVSGEATVSSVPTDRGFWIEEAGERAFVVLIDQPAEAPLDINEGQVLRLAEVMVRTDVDMLDEIPGVPIDDDTRRIVADQPLYLVVDERNVEILSR